MKKLFFILPLALMLFACEQEEPVEDVTTEDIETVEVVAEVDSLEEIPVEETVPTTVTARHILICYDGCAVNEEFGRTKEEALALIEDIEAKIASGEMTFVQAAIDYSNCPSSADGGMLGEFGRGAMVPAFEEAAFSLPVGGVSGVVETQFGYHLVYREV